MIKEQGLKKNTSKDIGEFFTNSKTFSIFCERVYGKDLCQLNRIDMTQLDKLLTVLDLSDRDRVLDLGCGLGRITEYISDMTHARLIGIDIAAEAIRRAQNRTKEKRNRLEFHKADIEKISFPPETFNCIIAIDSLYGDMVSDLEKSISRIKTLLKPNGQMGIFYTEYRGDPSDSVDILEPSNTQLAQALKNQTIDFQTWDFTQNEQFLLQRMKLVAEQLKEEFRLEEKLHIYENRMKASERLLPRIKKGLARRYLYHVRLSKIF
ncbi:MAG: class I SAM-dependent methyltransferase [Candidatus Hodarchaeota archaeon]